MSVSESAKEQMDKYFETVPQLNLDIEEFRKIISSSSKTERGVDEVKNICNSVSDRISELSDDIKEFIKEFREFAQNIKSTGSSESPDIEDLRASVLREQSKLDIPVTPGKVSVLQEVRSLKKEITEPLPEDEPEEGTDPSKVIEGVLKKKDEADYSRFKTLKETTEKNNPKSIFDKITQFITIALLAIAAWPKIKETLLQVKDNLLDYFEEHFPKLNATLSKGFENWKKWGELISKIWNKLNIVLDTIWDTIVEIHDWIRPKSRGAQKRKQDKLNQRIFQWARENDTRSPEEIERDNTIFQKGMEEGIPLAKLIRADKSKINPDEPVAAQVETQFKFNSLFGQDSGDSQSSSTIPMPGFAGQNIPQPGEPMQSFADFLAGQSENKPDKPSGNSIGVSQTRVVINNYMLQGQSPTD